VKSITRIRRGDANEVQLPTGAVRRIAAGRDHSVVVTFDGAVFTWGRGDHGQLGHGSFMDVPEPKQVIALADDAGAMKVVDVSAGGKFTLFLLRDGAVFVSGQDPSRPDFPELLTPELVEFSTRSSADEGEDDSDENGNHAFITVAAGESHFALATEEGEVFESSSSHDTDNKTEAGLSHARQLLKVSGLDGVVRVRAGASHTLVLCDGGGG
jgi:alpha-tubulin suppressor-like RCC1 family protein